MAQNLQNSITYDDNKDFYDGYKAKGYTNYLIDLNSDQSGNLKERYEKFIKETLKLLENRSFLYMTVLSTTARNNKYMGLYYGDDLELFFKRDQKLPEKTTKIPFISTAAAYKKYVVDYVPGINDAYMKITLKNFCNYMFSLFITIASMIVSGFMFKNLSIEFFNRLIIPEQYRSVNFTHAQLSETTFNTNMFVHVSLKDFYSKDHMEPFYFDNINTNPLVVESVKNLKISIINLFGNQVFEVTDNIPTITYKVFSKYKELL